MTFSEQLLSIADDCGQVPYATALYASDIHGLANEFITLYGSAVRWVSCGVDAGELLDWLGY
jgi:hypothetical protein